eukprot:gene20965-biopygen11635
MHNHPSFPPLHPLLGPPQRPAPPAAYIRPQGLPPGASHTKKCGMLPAETVDDVRRWFVERYSWTRAPVHVSSMHPTGARQPPNDARQHHAPHRCTSGPFRCTSVPCTPPVHPTELL